MSECGKKNTAEKKNPLLSKRSELVALLSFPEKKTRPLPLKVQKCAPILLAEMSREREGGTFHDTDAFLTTYLLRWRKGLNLHLRQRTLQREELHLFTP